MHSPAELTLPLMVQSGDGATSPEAEAIRMAWALSGTPTLPSGGGAPTPPQAPAASASAQERNCPQCGAVLYAGETSCWKCGAKVGDASAGTPLPSAPKG